ncbi:hypothetical protein [Gemmatimonas groenlandica]|uniref:Lipoprotein n=1 Tax=Gemmatimonas groenlandica TaxID=2732249 RepID=A0A6M4IUT3_9BACT|nr:hypothetical protein [Gemmatimonas groenlandica]QJR37529.1 hypothetical protein HKW67_19425 [Gemmatimonas groenlandica]
MLRDPLIVCGVGMAMLLMASCKPAADDERLRTVNETLRELQLPPARARAMTSDGGWRVVVDSSSSTRLLLIHQVAALVLPDGTITLTEPVTAFRFTDNRWRQSASVLGSEVLPAAVEALLAPEFKERDHTYVYLAHCISLDTRDVAGAQLAAQIRASVSDMTQRVARYRRLGFIGADAEP